MSNDAQKQPKDQKPKEAKEGPFVLISTTNGKTRRRAGLRFTPEGTKVDVSKLDAKQKEALQADPMLKIKD